SRSIPSAATRGACRARSRRRAPRPAPRRAWRPPRRAWRSARRRGRSAPSEANGDSRVRKCSSGILLVMFSLAVQSQDARLAQEDRRAGPLTQPSPRLAACRERRVAAGAHCGAVQDQLLPAVHVVERSSTPRGAAGRLADGDAGLDDVLDQIERPLEHVAHQQRDRLAPASRLALERVLERLGDARVKPALLGAVHGVSCITSGYADRGTWEFPLLPVTPRLHVEKEGDGPAVVLAHGFAGSARNFGPQARALRTGFRVTRYDARGHARSEAPDD